MVTRLVTCVNLGFRGNAVEVFIFWDIMQHSLAMVYRHMGQTISPTFKGQAVQCFALVMGPTDCPETLVFFL